jgi:hypothetical protein
VVYSFTFANSRKPVGGVHHRFGESIRRGGFEGVRRGAVATPGTHATMNSEESYDPSEHVTTVPKERTWIDVTS